MFCLWIYLTTALKSGNFEPKVPSYDFLARIKENRKLKQEQARGRFGPVDEFPSEDKEDDEPENMEGVERDKMEKFEDEMFGEDTRPADAKTHAHVELWGPQSYLKFTLVLVLCTLIDIQRFDLLQTACILCKESIILS